jgi:hypothetical protein
MIVDAQYGGVVVYAGDAVKNSCTHIDVRDNVFKNMGWPHRGTGGITSDSGTGQSALGGIFFGSVFACTAHGNKFDGWQASGAIVIPPISALGPGTWLNTLFSGSPREASLSIKNNEFILRSNFGTNSDNYYDASSTTPSCISVSGLWDDVLIRGNHVKTDRFFQTDTRNDAGGYFIQLTMNGSTTIGQAQYWPTQVAISDNDANCWVGPGIQVLGPGSTANPGAVKISNNTLAYTVFTGIDVESCASPAIVGNSVIASGYGAGNPSYIVNQCANVLFTGNSSEPRALGGTDGTTYSLQITNCTTAMVVGNRLPACVTGAVNTSGSTGVTQINNI